MRRQTPHRCRLEQIRQAFPQPISNPVHDSYFVHSILRALDAVDSMKSELPILGKVRPPDYATSFARQALQHSGVSWPFAVCAKLRPPWLEAVASEPGVLDVGLEEAGAFYADVE